MMSLPQQIGSDSALAEPSDNIAPLQKLLRLFQFDVDVARQGAELWALLAPHADRIIDQFYADLRTVQVHPHISGTVLKRLKVKQKSHWAALFSSSFDANYVRSVRRVGIRHREVRLGSAWYVAGYLALKYQFMNVIVTSKLPVTEKGHMLRVLEKFVAVDVALALSVYDDNISTVLLD